ncbi:MAG: uroporphyrinogen-III synthase [Caldisericaceae bacterium]|nr:uroporphyrinogen-III synthase [Caldisericaceae bacterium]
MKLKNKKIVITRQPQQADNLIRLLEQEGAQPLLFPTIATVAASENEEEQRHILQNLDQFDWLVFSSENGVRFFVDALKFHRVDFPEIKIAAVGSRTAESLENLGFKVDLIPDDFSARGLIDAFSTMELRGRHFLIPASNISRDELASGLKFHGADVKTVVFYKTVPNPDFNQENFCSLLRNKAIDVITFFSPSAFNFLIELLKEEGLNLLQLSETHLAAIGKTTARAIHEQGLKVHIMPKVSTSRELVKAIVDYYQKEN